MKLKINKETIKVMKSAIDGIVEEMKIITDGQVLEEVAVFKMNSREIWRGVKCLER